MQKKRRLIVALSLGLVLLVGLLLGAPALAIDRAGKVASTAQADTLPTQPAPQPDRAVVVKGAVLPVQRAVLSTAASGVVAEVLAKEGDRLAVGQVILRLQNQRQKAALAEADAGVASAQARLAILKAGARSQEVAVAQAALDAANGRLARLQQTGRAEDIAAAQASLAAAQAAYKHLFDGPDPNAKTAAAADVASTEAAVRNAQAAYDQVKSDANIGMLPQSLQLQQATIAYQAAMARYGELMAPPTADRVAAAAAQISQTQATIDKLKQPATAADLAEAQAGVRQAQSQLDLLNAGPRGEDIKAAEAAVSQAQAAQQGAAASLADTELRAPFAGTLVYIGVRQGEQVAAGMPIVDIGDLTAWQVETDDLSELDVVRVQPGQSVRLTFDAVPGLELQGTIDRVQPLGKKKLGDMTYMAVVRLDSPDPRLLWNMTAVVTLPQE